MIVRTAGFSWSVGTIIGVFVLTWIVALTVWHVGNIEEKWTAGMAGLALGADGTAYLGVTDDRWTQVKARATRA